MQSSHYHSSSAYEDLRLPPIRNPGSYSSSSRPHTGARYVTPMEPPTHTSSTIHPRNPSVSLPPLVQPPRRPSSSMGHASHSYGSAPLAPTHGSRHPPTSHSSALPTSPSHQRPSTSQHRRTSSLAINTADPPSSYSAYGHSPQSAHSSSGGHHESTSPTSTTRGFACDLCGATFSRAYDCKRHREIHTRQGGYECPYCHKSLSRADALKRHMERGCSGMDDDDMDELDRDREKRDKRDKRHSTGGDEGTKYYYTSVHSRHR